MSEVNRLQKLMEQGWNIHIECKGKGRGYEMTFEASANRVLNENMSEAEKTASLYSNTHAVGNTLSELLDELERKINVWMY